jgi:hypothetical protein
MAFEHIIDNSGGMNYDPNDFIKLPNELKMLNGCNVDYKLGSIVKDLGYSQIGGTLQSSKSITGLYHVRYTGSLHEMLATVNDSGDADMQMFSSTGGAWTEVADAETAWATYEDANVEMAVLDTRAYFVGYDATDDVWLPPRTKNAVGNSGFGTTNTTNMPNAKYIIRYRDRLYLVNCDISGTGYPFRAYYSSVTTGDSISWTVATDFIDVDYAEQLTGAGENWDRLMLFTEYSAYAYNQTSKKKVWDVGCTNHRTIKNYSALMIWANHDGIWASNSGTPINVSEKLKKFIKAATPANFFAEVVDEEYHLYIGTVTVDGITYTNTEIIWNIPHNTFRIRELADNLTIYARFNSSGVIKLWHGDTDGEVMERSKYSDASPVYGDDGSDIRSHFRTQRLHFGSPQDRKMFSKILAYTEQAQGLRLSARIIDKRERALTKWKKLGECTKYISEFTARS